MLDINLFRNNPEIIRESQRKRFKDVGLVDKVIDLDVQWKKELFKLSNLQKIVNLISKKVAILAKSSKTVQNQPNEKPEELEHINIININLNDLANINLDCLDIDQLRKLSKSVSIEIKQLSVTTSELENEKNKTILLIGNIVGPNVPISANEDDNVVHRIVGFTEPKSGLLNHVDLMYKIGGIDMEKGSEISGSRAYFMKGPLVQLHLALVNYSINFLAKKEYTTLYTPYFMNQTIMGKVAQLEQFDEELYKVTGDGEDKYLIATSEQPIAAYHLNENFTEKQLPIKYAGFSSCFRKEAGSHGKDTSGIFRVHQFDKIEQFCVTSPHDNNSWELWEQMIATSEEFYQSLDIPYRVISIVSGALNNAAAAKYDLEGYFPASNTFRELVSCSNCTDYQARRLDTQYIGQNTPSTNKDKEYVHMLNSTLCATTRTLCIICEQNQTDTGIKVPKVLVPYTGFDFIKFI